jgi:hypothetical protein
VAALVPNTYLSGSTFTATTRPTLTQVERWIDTASATLNSLLAKAGFRIPISQADAKMSCDQIIAEIVTELCHAKNNTGRFFTDRALERGVAPMKVLRQEMADWVEANAVGLANLGATRLIPDAGQVAFRDTDESGDEIHPIFQRDGFGNSF